MILQKSETDQMINWIVAWCLDNVVLQNFQIALSFSWRVQVKILVELRQYSYDVFNKMIVCVLFLSFCVFFEALLLTFLSMVFSKMLNWCLFRVRSSSTSSNCMIMWSFMCTLKVGHLHVYFLLLKCRQSLLCSLEHYQASW